MSPRTRLGPPRFVLVAMMVLIAALAGCSGSSAGVPGTVSVVASFYPLAEAAEQVGGAAVSVTNLTAPGVEPHDLELTPQQKAELKFLQQGINPTPKQLDKAIEDFGKEALK